MLSIIAGISGYDETRMENFRYFVRSVSRQRGVPFEFIVVEQLLSDGDAAIYGDMLNEEAVECTHTVVHAKAFNKSWLLNIGAGLSKGEILVFFDADVVFDEGYFAAISAAWPFRFMLGWSEAAFLSAAGRRALLDRGYETKKCQTDRIVVPKPGSSACMGLCNIFERFFFFYTVGGYNETFTRWGGEDCDIMKRSLAATESWRQLDYTLYHLHHGGRVRGDRNTKMWNMTRESPEEVSRLIMSAGLGDRNGPRQLGVA